MSNKKDTGKNYSLAFSAIAIIISAGSLIFSIWVYQISQEERLLVDLRLFESNKQVYLQEDKGIGNFYPLALNIECVLVNIGNRPLSIISHDIYELRDKEEHIPIYKSDSDSTNTFIVRGKQENYFMHYLGFYSTSGESENLPFTLDVGESKRVLMRVEVNIDKKVYAILKSELDIGKAYGYPDVLKILSNHSTDIFGNEVTYSVQGNGDSFRDYIMLYSDSENRNKQTLKVEFKTSRGEMFSSKIDILHFSR